MTSTRLYSGLVLSGALAFSLGTSFTAETARADAVSDFYKNNRIEMLVGSGPGGGYDTYARLIGRHMGSHIPGNPDFLVKNMDGAGSILAANFVVNIAPKDGTVIAGLQRNLALVQIMGQSGPKFKAQELNWLGSLANEAGVCAIATRTGIKSFDEVFTRSFNMGGTGPNDTEIWPALSNNTIGAQFRLIKGYPSTPPVHLAIERGEVDGICQSWSSFKVHSGKFLEEGNIKPIVQITLKAHPELSKLGVPMISDFITPERVKSGMTVDEVNSYFNLLMAAKAMGRPFAMAPGVPEDRIKAMRAAFVATAEDSKFLADAKKQKRDVELVTGDEIQEIVGKMAATPRATLDNLDSLMVFKGPTETAKVELPKFTGKVTQTKREGRRIFIMHEGKEIMAKVSGSRTAVSVDGKKAKRAAVKAGMTCTFEYTAPGSEAVSVSCKK